METEWSKVRSLHLSSSPIIVLLEEITSLQLAQVKIVIILIILLKHFAFCQAFKNTIYDFIFKKIIAWGVKFFTKIIKVLENLQCFCKIAKLETKI